jgi:hypothetical protein
MPNILGVNKFKVLFLICTGLALIMLKVTYVEGANTKEKPLEQLMIEWEEAGIDANHTETIERIRSYVEQKMVPGTFASLHIDREEKPLGVIVLSFTNEVDSKYKQEIEALVKEPAEVSFRVVTYTEAQLLEKQAEIDHAVFEKDVLGKEGITVYHTSSDIINNKVEIGISPFNDENTQTVYDYFGEDMVNVVEGQQAVLETDSPEAENQPKEEQNIDKEKVSIFEKLIHFINRLFRNS